jgi:hypothetical protein
MSITKADLENLYHLTGEIRDIENQLLRISRLSENYVADTIRDYSQNAKGNIKVIRGYGLSESTYRKQQQLYEKLRVNRKELIEKKMKIEEEVERIEDVMIRRIIRLRFYDHLSWETVAIAIGDTRSGDSVRMQFNRYLKDFIKLHKCSDCSFLI